MLKIRLEKFVPVNKEDIYDDWSINYVEDEVFEMEHESPDKRYKIHFKVSRDGSNMILYNHDQVIKCIRKRFPNDGCGYVRINKNRTTDKIITFYGKESSELLDEFGIECVKTFEKGNNYNFIINKIIGNIHDSNKELIVPVGGKFSLHEVHHNKNMIIHVDDIPLLVSAASNINNIYNVKILDSSFVIFNEYIHNKITDAKHVKRVLICHKGYNILKHRDELEKIKNAGLLNDKDGYTSYE